VIAAVEAAVDTDPDNAALRLHLGSLLLDADRAPEALPHLERVVLAEPDNAVALRCAARAARLTGDEGRAASWDRVLHLLEDDASGVEDGAETSDQEPPASPRVEVSDQPSSEHDWDGELRDLLDDPAIRRRVTLSDVGGLDHVKRRLDETFFAPMRNPELSQMYGKSLRGGLLLWGPPGCGKTFLARAVAGELGAHFIGLGLVDVLDMYLGQSERNLHGIFEAARRRSPCVLFLDEVDALGHKRMDLARSAGRNVVAQLLTELDGLSEDNAGLFVLAATNQPWDVEPALRRPGRLDRTVLVLPPDEEARAAILAFHLRDRPTESLELRDVARRTDGFSGADLALLSEAAAEAAIADSIRSGHARPIRLDDIEAALGTIAPSTGAWFDAARNFAKFGNRSGEYDELLEYLRTRRR
jgi:SpoVK/Ycf46/Vps4 family AAA+-type ATPase